MKERTETVRASSDLCEAVIEAIYNRKAYDYDCSVVILNEEEFRDFERQALLNCFILPEGISSLEGMTIIRYYGVDIMPSSRVPKGIIYSY